MAYMNYINTQKCDIKMKLFVDWYGVNLRQEDCYKFKVNLDYIVAGLFQTDQQSWCLLGACQ